MLQELLGSSLAEQLVAAQEEHRRALQQKPPNKKTVQELRRASLERQAIHDQLKAKGLGEDVGHLTGEAALNAVKGQLWVAQEELAQLMRERGQDVVQWEAERKT